MDRRRSLLVQAVAALLLLFLTVAAAGCSADPPPPRWEELTSGSFSGAKTERLDLGTFYLAKGARVAWDLAGPADARAEFRLKVVNLSNTDSWSVSATSVQSWKENFDPRSEEALSMGVSEQGEYHFTLIQRLPRRSRAGFAGGFTLYTQDLD
jgi:hypothetical protein